MSNLKILKSAFIKEINIKKSRFICYAKPVSSEAEAKEFIKEISSKHSDATHNCPAYIIGDNQEFRWCSDDGEPSGTAGLPMLNILEKNNITDVACVVTRYFGGIMLGAPGLVRAYSQSVKELLEEASFVKKDYSNLIEVIVSYEYSNIENYVRKNYLVKDINFGNNLSITIITKDTESLKLDLTNFTKGNVNFIEKGLDICFIDC